MYVFIYLPNFPGLCLSLFTTFVFISFCKPTTPLQVALFNLAHCPGAYIFQRPPLPPPRVGLYLEFALEYKVKQRENGKFPSNCKLAQSILKPKFPSIHKPLQNKTMFYLKINSYFVKLCNKTCGTLRFRISLMFNLRCVTVLAAVSAKSSVIQILPTFN